MTPEKLCELAKEAMTHAYAPYSGFKVGAALLCADGTVYQGCNIENAAYGPTNCAERTAVFKAVSEGHRGDWVAMAVAGRGEEFCWPCGSCRQMLYEFAPELRVLAVRGDGNFAQAKLSDLLPCGFGASHLK